MNSQAGNTHKQKVSVPNHPPRISLISHSDIPHCIARSQHMQNARPLKFGFALDDTRVGQPVFLRRHENPKQWGSPWLINRRSEHSSAPLTIWRSRRLAVVGRGRRGSTRSSRHHSSDLSARPRPRAIGEFRDDAPMGDDSFCLSA